MGLLIWTGKQFNALFCLGLSLLLALGSVVSGCKKKEEQAPAAEQPNTAQAAFVQPSIRIHWLGKKHVSADTNSNYLMSIWDMPESAKVEEQTLQRLALTPWHVFSTNTEQSISTNAQARLLLPLLRNVLEEEVYADLLSATNKTAAFSLAIRLKQDQAAMWQKNLGSAMKAMGGDLTPSKSVAGSLTGQLRSGGGSSNVVQLSRAGEWTVLGIGNETTNVLFDQMLRQSQSGQAPIGGANAWHAIPGRVAKPPLYGATTGSKSAEPDAPWLQIQVQTAAVPFLNGVLDTVSNNAGFVAIEIAGEKGRLVRTRADLVLETPLNLHLDPWHLPTNLVSDPLIGFSAVRGFKDLLSGSWFWQKFGTNDAPNEAFFWAQSGMPDWHFMALPLQDSTNEVLKLTDFATNTVNNILATNQPKYGSFLALTNGPGVSWRGIPWVSPSVRDVADNGNNYLFAGFSSVRNTNKPGPSELWSAVGGPTNLVYYDWEITGPCVDGLSQVIQMVRNVFGLPRLTYSAALSWLKAMEPKLSNSATEIRQISPTHLSLQRSSSIGFTAAELELIADWLESPTFPAGLHTFVAPRPVPKAPPRGNGTAIAATNQPGRTIAPAAPSGAVTNAAPNK